MTGANKSLVSSREDGHAPPTIALPNCCRGHLVSVNLSSSAICWVFSSGIMCFHFRCACAAMKHEVSHRSMKILHLVRDLWQRHSKFSAMNLQDWRTDLASKTVDQIPRLFFNISPITIIHARKRKANSSSIDSARPHLHIVLDWFQPVGHSSMLHLQLYQGSLKRLHDAWSLVGEMQDGQSASVGGEHELWGDHSSYAKQEKTRKCALVRVLCSGKLLDHLPSTWLFWTGQWQKS